MQLIPQKRKTGCTWIERKCKFLVYQLFWPNSSSWTPRRNLYTTLMDLERPLLPLIKSRASQHWNHRNLSTSRKQTHATKVRNDYTAKIESQSRTTTELDPVTNPVSGLQDAAYVTGACTRSSNSYQYKNTYSQDTLRNKNMRNEGAHELLTTTAIIINDLSCSNHLQKWYRNTSTGIRLLMNPPQVLVDKRRKLIATA